MIIVEKDSERIVFAKTTAKRNRAPKMQAFDLFGNLRKIRTS